MRGERLLQGGEDPGASDDVERTGYCDDLCVFHVPLSYRLAFETIRTRRGQGAMERVGCYVAEAPTKPTNLACKCNLSTIRPLKMTHDMRINKLSCH
jgi:hypothetical protein